MKRRSVFLLEVMIAVLLIGVFASMSLRGFCRAVNGQRDMVRAVQWQRHLDVKRMELVEKYWTQGEALAASGKVERETVDKKTFFEVSCKKDKAGACHLLRFKLHHNKESRTYYHFLEPKSGIL